MLSALPILVSCSPDKGLEKLSAADGRWQSDLAALRGKRIFFGHQSVGRNILEGLAELVRESGDSALAIRDAGEEQERPGAVALLAHARVGANGDPESKCRGLARYLSESPVPYDAAVLKFCYVDVKEKTDVDAMLEIYRRNIRDLRAQYPGTVFIHATVPLSSGTTGFKLAVKRLIRWEDYADGENARRSEFNRKLREAFPGEPFFDIAALESTHADSSREGFRRAGQVCYSLIPSLTHDGAHLNTLGRRLAAKALIRSLADALAKGRG